MRLVGAQLRREIIRRKSKKDYTGLVGLKAMYDVLYKTL
jgi:hypothetical protein